MSLQDAMKPNNGGIVSRLINKGYDAKDSSGLTVIQLAALKYSADIGKAGSLTGKAEKLRAQWRETIKPLIDSKVTFTRVTSRACNSSFVSGLLKVVDVLVDSMLHELGFLKSEIAKERGYICYF